MPDPTTPTSTPTPTPTSAPPRLSLGPQYTAPHVYVSPAGITAFTGAVVATFGGEATAPMEISITPTPSRNLWSLVTTPTAMLSVFGFTTPVPYPFGTEAMGYGVADVDEAAEVARSSGAHILVAPFSDKVGRDVVIQFPGGPTVQLYHAHGFVATPRETICDHRVYVPESAVDAFVATFLAFSGGEVVSDDRRADGRLLGRPGTTHRQVRLTSDFGGTVVLGTDGHLPHPFGRDVLGVAVADVDATCRAAAAGGAQVLWGPDGTGAACAVLGFPEGVAIEIHETGTAAGGAS